MRALLLGSWILVGCASRASCPAGDLSPPAQAPAFVVVRSDFSSGAVALLAADGSLIDHDFVDSGTQISSLVTSVAGDVSVPSTPLGLGAIAWIDRLNHDELTIVVGSAAPIEIDTRGESLSTPHTGFSANPQDAVLLDDGRILISRLSVNPDRSAPELQRGNDVVVVEGGVVTDRLDLHADSVQDACTAADCVAYAHPAVMLPLRSGDARAVLVVLERLSGDLRGGAGPGAVLAIDAQTLAVGPALEVRPLENCQFASIDPNDPSRAYVSCTGLQTLAPEMRRAAAGVVEITLDATGALAQTGLFQSAARDLPIGGAVIALGERRVLVVAHDSSTGDADLPDHLLEIDVGAGTSRDVYQSHAGFQLYGGTLAGRTALVPEIESSSILRFDVIGPATLRDRVVIDDCVGLPPVQIAPIRFE